MNKPFLLLQLRPEDAASDDELAAFLKFGGLSLNQVKRVRMEQGPIPGVDLGNYAGVIVGGGPSNVSDKNKGPDQQRFEAELQDLLGKIVASDVPFLGACYGFSALLNHLGGEISKEKYSEGVGATTIKLTSAGQSDSLTRGLPESFRAFGGHKEAAQSLPPEITRLAESETCPIQMIKVRNNIYATQFHPELDALGLEVRVNVYKHAGYFPPDAADELIQSARQEKVIVPAMILKRFVERYSAAS